MCTVNIYIELHFTSWACVGCGGVCVCVCVRDILYADLVGVGCV